MTAASQSKYAAPAPEKVRVPFHLARYVTGLEAFLGRALTRDEALCLVVADRLSPIQLGGFKGKALGRYVQAKVMRVLGGDITRDQVEDLLSCDAQVRDWVALHIQSAAPDPAGVAA